MNKQEELDVEEIKHNNKMLELETERKFKLEVHKAEHEYKMAEIRLKNANIQRTQARQEFR